MASTETHGTVHIHPDELVTSVLDEQASLSIRRLFTREGRDPFDEIEWETRDAHIPGRNGPAFEQRGVEFPKFWSQTATNIVAQKYFRGRLSSPERERSVKEMVGRVVTTIGAWGRQDGYFGSEEEAETFEAELKAILVNQLAAFNSPVWFNVGFEEKPQCSACFILSIEDSMDAILDWIRREGIIFRGGSGSGVNLSRLRSSKEQLSKGGYASGPVSFMRGADASAGTIKSGGKTRRAAKMVVLDVDHPDIVEFIWCKAHEEEKARVLEAAGYDMSLDSADWASIQYQNANNSVRVSDAFMEAVRDDADWNLTARTDGSVVETVKARKLMHEIAEAAWRCADPGLQYDTTINAWHTLPNTGRINASNPCSEYMSIDDSACNLASLNLMKFRRDDGELDVEAFEHAVDTVFLAQEILVGNSSYPTPEIERNAKAYRQLGLGYANLGALLMARGLAYDSDEGRAYAAAITALMTGRAYRKSAEIAKRMGPFAGYRPNAAAMLGVIAKHRAAVGNIANPETVPADLLGAARKAWDEALDLGEVYGYRNAQATVLAPTGTISFMMDCDTTGVEPDFSLVKSKKLVGGGEITIVNKTVAAGLEKLGYSPREVDEIVAFVDERNTVVGAPYVKAEHYPVFDCAVGERAIHYRGHVKMMGAIQPFISGAISKTVNLPETAT
ncbi:MAG TPA: vitamin B12-dependent ribonucleotide reductase, partial [Gaiellaceae bacterium]|nr:vitamin B12-dependent ribonucleotide reductase [Gaiellaceae bacterium]